MKSKKYVAYYRVSTREQGISGLGLNDQHFQVENHVGKENINQEFEEIVSGRKKDRPKLETAIEICKQNGHTLVVSKLDRLGRKVSHLFAIRDNMELLCVDKPTMSTMEFAIYAGMAQEEAEKISQRTMAALAAKKRQGFKLGSPGNLTNDARKKGRKIRKIKAQENKNNRRAFEFVKDERESGLSYQKIAKKLNKYGYKSPNDKQYYACSVRNLLYLYAN